MAREELRASRSREVVLNRVWDGSKIKLFGARNEVVSFNLVIEAGDLPVRDVKISFALLRGDSGQVIGSPATPPGAVFNWTNRNIENFFVRYLPVRGLSRQSYATDYDERHVPRRFRRPFSGNGNAWGSWEDRPDHDKSYPDVAVPLELVPSFTIPAQHNQSIWTDIYIPKSASAGMYRGKIRILAQGTVLRELPVELKVRNFTLPDTPSVKTMVFLGGADVNQRYTGETWPEERTPGYDVAKRVLDRHFQLAHRHKISLINLDRAGPDEAPAQPSEDWIPRLDGSLFTSAHGYAGPGTGIGNDVYSIGTYESWNSRLGTEAEMHLHSDAWEKWFGERFPSTERFIYLFDESRDFPEIEKLAGWLKSNPGPGRSLRSFATLDLLEAQTHAPSLDIAATWLRVGRTEIWEAAVARAQSEAKPTYFYNGNRPAGGTFALEDDGVALRQLAWGQYKKKIDRWFYWESTYYNDYHNGRGPTNVFRDAMTFGENSMDPANGIVGSNGDGVLFYPGTDHLFPSDSYGAEGPIASLRLKHWRRGIQDVDYLTLARAVNPTRTEKVLNRMVPKVLWEYGISDPSDPTWVNTDISWSVDPDDWDAAREDLAQIIESGH